MLSIVSKLILNFKKQIHVQKFKNCFFNIEKQFVLSLLAMLLMNDKKKKMQQNKIQSLPFLSDKMIVFFLLDCTTLSCNF